MKDETADNVDFASNSPQEHRGFSKKLEAKDELTNAMGSESDRITPKSLKLVQLNQEQIDSIVRTVPGGPKNVQDIYPLSPVQEGMLFHHLLNDTSDTYVLLTLLELQTHVEVDAFIDALQKVIDRHDILRSAMIWENLPRPVQVVYREAKLEVVQLVLDPQRNPIEQLKEHMRPERQRINLQRAPLVRLQIAKNPSDARCYALLQIHHMVCDHQSWDLVLTEAIACLKGGEHELPAPGIYRDYVVWALANARTQDAEAFFGKQLGDVEDSTAPFGLFNVHGDGNHIEEARQILEPGLAQRVRIQARSLGMSAARLFHAAWALVVARTSGRDDVVYGSVLLAAQRRQARAERTLGLFVNTLPLRLNLRKLTALQLVQETCSQLGETLKHEQASLTLAQRCSGNAGPAPLFTAVLNYRHSVGHSVVDPRSEWTGAAGIRVLAHQYRTNYPVGMSVDNLGHEFSLIAQTEPPVDPARIIGYFQTAVRSLVDALEQAPQTRALSLSVLPESERYRLIESFNATGADYPEDRLIHELFEEQVRSTPHAVAVVHEERALTYLELNSRANQLARYLREEGAYPERLVALCIERSVDMLVGLLGVLKAGGAYVPLDPTNPFERLEHVLNDARPIVILTHEALKNTLPPSAAKVIALDSAWSEICKEDDENLDAQSLGLSSRDLAYVIYTSGSTGIPKGVMVEHRNIVNYAVHALRQFDVISGDGSLVCTSISFDLMLTGLYPTLLSGRTVRLCSEQHGVPALTDELLRSSNLAPLKLTPSHLGLLEDALRSRQLAGRVQVLVLGGEPLQAGAVQAWREHAPGTRIFNHYGPTEATVGCVVHEIVDRFFGAAPIGRPISNTQIYILDRHFQPVPIGVTGEIYIGGAGVARGYLNRPELTAERFVANPFRGEPYGRLYKTGDLGRWQANGTIEFGGRNDHQIKLRGYRIEIGEIEAQLARHAQVREALVLVREDVPGEKRLVAYVVGNRTATRQAAGSPEKLRSEIVKEWATVHEETYQTNQIAGPSFVGWNSSYTGQPIPDMEMHEWLSNTIDRIQELQPKKLLEIGCGVGLLLQHIAPDCDEYVGVDFAANALDQLRQWKSGREDLKHVELLHRAATELQDLQSSSFDTVILNSVIQYFPDVDYLLRVLEEGLRLLRPGGTIFIGDVRHLGLLRMFHSAVQLGKAAATVSVGQLRKRVARSVAHDQELVIDPRFFQALPSRLPGVSAVEIQLKRGQSQNELTRYRYDVVLHTSECVGANVACEQLQWDSGVGCVAELEAALVARRWSAVRLRSVPNLRLARDAAAQRLIETSDEDLDASAIRCRLNELRFEGVDPEQFWNIAQAHGYHVQLGWELEEQQGRLDVQLVDRAQADRLGLLMAPQPEAVKFSGAYANDPLASEFRQQLIPQLREYLKELLPDYMIPSAWLVLNQFPLTPNGKVDRRALPNPQGRPEELGEYIAPSTDAERTIADIWAQVLQLDQVGMEDNFFELGGHSLLAMQVVARIRSSLSIEMPMRLLFEFPTIRQLSSQVDGLRQARLRDAVAGGGDEIEELVGRVAAMSERQAQELLLQLRMR